MTAVSRQIRLRKCRHCGSGFEPRHPSDEYCCSGCALVREMIEGAGFSDFYRLLGDNSLLPQGESAAPSLDWIESGKLGESGDDGAGGFTLGMGVDDLQTVRHRR